MAPVILVYGPPCAGKTHYAHQHAATDDVILDRDQLGATDYNHAVEQLARSKPAHTTWVIACLAGPTKRAAFAQHIRADHTVRLVPPDDVLHTRAHERTHPRRWITAITTWNQRETADQQPTEPRPRTPRPASQRGKGRTGRPLRELRKRVFAEETNCWICGHWVDQTLPRSHPMSRTLDHVIELHRGGDPLARQNSRLAHRRCNTGRSNRLRGADNRGTIHIDLGAI